MKITRSGANRGMWRTLLVWDKDDKFADPNWNMGKQKVSFDELHERVTLNALNVESGGLRGRYNYEVFLSVKDIAEILSCLASEGLKEIPAEIEGALKPARAAMLRLLLHMEEAEPATGQETD